MEAAVRELIASLGATENVERQWQTIDDWAAESRVERMVDTADALAADRPAHVPEWAAESVVERIGRLLATTPRPEFADAARRVARRWDARELASVAASSQPVEICAELVVAGESLDQEFLGCLVHELVLRFENLEREPFFSWLAQMRMSQHPLAWLPLRLHTAEAKILLPSYTLQGMSYPVPAVTTAEAPADAVKPRIRPLSVETTNEEDRMRMTMAVRTWLEKSNGVAEPRVFALRSGRPDRPLGSSLVEARLECLGGGAPMTVAPVDVTGAFSLVFAAASTGGAYDHGHRGAYGRLHAWETMGALAGTRSGEPFQRVAEAATAARWFTFTTESGWFNEIAWDLALAAISADEARLAILAATDTD